GSGLGVVVVAQQVEYPVGDQEVELGRDPVGSGGGLGDGDLGAEHDVADQHRRLAVTGRRRDQAVDGERQDVGGALTVEVPGVQLGNAVGVGQGGGDVAGCPLAGRS